MGRKRVVIAAAVAALLVVAWVAAEAARAPSGAGTTPRSAPQVNRALAPPVQRPEAAHAEGRAPSPGGAGSAALGVAPVARRWVHGRVVTRADEPVAGATVYLEVPRRDRTGVLAHESWPDAGSASKPPPAPLQVETDAEGRFAASMEPAEELVIAVRAAGLAGLDRVVCEAELGIEPGAALELGSLTLEPGARVRGRIVDEGGRPVAGASILRRGRTRSGLSLEGSRLASSAADGTFALDFLPLGRVSLEIRARGFLPKEELVYLQSESVDGLRIALPAAASITGRVRGAPAGTELFVGSLLEEGWRTVPCAEDGSFRIDAFAARPEPVSIFASRSDEFGRPGAFRISPILRVVPGAQGVELVVPAPTTFRVSLVDARTRAPVAGARFGYGRLEFERDRPVEVREVEPGVYDCTTIVADPAGEIVLDVQREGYASLALGQVRGLPGGTRDLGSVELRPLAPTRLRVSEASDGSPVAGVELSAEVETFDQECESDPSTTRWPARSDIDTSWSGTSAEDGCARAFLSPGHATWISARSPGHATLWKRVEVGRDPPAEVELALRRGGTIEVVVRDETGAARAGARVTCEAPAPSDGQRVCRNGARFPAPSHRVGREGRGCFRNLAPGTYRLWMGSGSRRVDAQVPVVEGGTVEVELVTRSRGQTRAFGRITENGVALPGAMVRLASDEAPTDARGCFEMADVDPGETGLVVTHPGFGALLRRSCVLHPGDNRIDVDLMPTALRGTVRDERGLPLAGAQAWIELPDGGSPLTSWTEERRHPYRATSGDDGTFLFPGIQPQEGLELRIEKPGCLGWRSGPLAFAAGTAELVLDPVLERAADAQVRAP